MTTPSALIAAIMARVVAEIPAATSTLTSSELATNASPPHVRWCPDTDTYGPAPKRMGTDGARSVLGVDTAWLVECWGADFDGAVTLRDAVLRATAAEAHGMVAYGPGQWSKGGTITEGEAVTLRITLKGYVPELPAVLATVTTVHTNDTTGSASGDGLLDVGES